MRVLILDDESVRLDAYAERYKGHIVHCATNAQEAVDLLGTWHYDIVQLDHDLGSGCETGERVAQYLASMDAHRPELVVVHSHNPVGAKRMLDVLRDAGVNTLREPFKANR